MESEGLIKQVLGNGALIKRLVAYELGRSGDSRLVRGWNSRLFDLREDQGARLVDAGVLRLVPCDPERGRRYLLVDREAVAALVATKVAPRVVNVDQVGGLDSQPAGEAVVLLNHEGSPSPLGEEAPPPKLEGGDVAPDFDDIVGYGDVKQLISESVRLGARVHYLLLGPPGSAKTLFLLGVERLSGSAYVLGSRMSRSGLAGFLMDSRPRFLLVDEVDKLPARDLAPLLSLAESGRVVETLNRKRVEAWLDTVVFVAANSIKRLPPELLSRFQVLEFPEYTRDEFIEVCKRVLVRREGLYPLEAGQIAIRVLDELRSKDVRTAVRVARLARTSLGIDGVIEVFKTYKVGRRRR